MPAAGDVECFEEEGRTPASSLIFGSGVGAAKKVVSADVGEGEVEGEGEVVEGEVEVGRW